MKIRLFAIPAVFLSIFLLSGCGDQATRDITFGDSDKSAGEIVDIPGGGGGGGGRKTGADVSALPSVTNAQLSNALSSPVERKIIRNADLDLESDAPEETQVRITQLAEGMGGFVVESQQRATDIRSTRRDSIMMTVRVPADKFEEALEAIRKAAARVVVESVKGQDVTEEFIDIEARLKAHQALEMQFMEIMKRANTVEDALNVQRQLADVRGEIEKIEGRKRFLENQASFSTVKITITTPAAISASGAGFFSRFVDAVNLGLDAASGLILGLVTVVIALLPFLVIIVLPLFLVLRFLWRKFKRRKAAMDLIREELGEETENV